MSESRRMKFLEGITVTTPLSFSASFSSIIAYSSDALFVASEGSPQQGSIYYNSSSLKVRVYNGTAWEDVGEDKREGITSLSVGESFKTIVFSSAYKNSSYIPHVSILCDDSDPIFLSFIIQNRTVNGFEVKLNAAVDSNNYKISYRIGDQL
jgi:hypothetical protein